MQVVRELGKFSVVSFVGATSGIVLTKISHFVAFILILTP